MDLSKALAEILEGSDGSRINTVANILKDGNVGPADDLKYFDWNSLKDLGGLSNMEVNKIMRYIQEKFPFEYEEHKRKRTEERKLQNEVEILNFKAEHEKKLQQEKMRFEKEMENRLNEQREMEEQLKCSQEQNDVSKGKTKSFKEKGKQLLRKINPFESTEEEAKMHAQTQVTGECFEGVKMSIDETIADIFTLFPSLSKKFIAEYLKNHCLVEELKQYDDKSMQAMRSLEAEVNEIMNYIKKKFPIDGGKNLKTGIQDDGFKRIELSTEEAVAKILEGCNSSRLIFVTRMLMEEGAQNSKELKSFNRNSLEGLGVLEKEEIDKFLKFIQES